MVYSGRTVTFVFDNFQCHVCSILPGVNNGTSTIRIQTLILKDLNLHNKIRTVRRHFVLRAGSYESKIEWEGNNAENEEVDKGEWL